MDKTKGKQHLIKVACVIAALILRMYIIYVENPIEDGRIRNVEVKIINQDYLNEQKLTMLPGQNFTITVNVRGRVTDINRLTPEDFEVVADLSGFVLRKGTQSIPVTIKKWPPNIDVLAPEIYRVDILLDDLKEKTVPVRTNLDIETRSGFQQFDPIIRPTNVLIRGAASYVDTVDFVLASGAARNADKDIELSLPLVAYNATNRIVPSQQISIEPKVADIIIPVKQVKTVGINFKRTGEIINNFILKSYEISPERVHIAGDPAIIGTITSIDILPIDMTNITSSRTIEAQLDLPRNVELVNNNGYVTVKLVIEQVIPRNITKNIVFRNLQEGYSYSADRTTVSLELKGPQGVISNLSADDIESYVDLKDLEGEHSLTLNVVVPQGVTVTSQSAQNVRVNITRVSEAASD
jgi:YbbR domain-containing protein